MVRRDFLKLSGLLSAVVFIQFNPVGKALSLPAEVEAQGKHYRGTPDGKIYISGDLGKSWQLHTNFGPALSIVGLSANREGQLHAHLGLDEHSFELALAPNGTTWRTV
jgi:hypothetical protein